MTTDQITKAASDIRVGDRAKLGCKWVTVATVEPQTRGPLRGQIALAAAHDWPWFCRPDDQIQVLVPRSETSASARELAVWAARTLTAAHAAARRES